MMVSKAGISFSTFVTEMFGRVQVAHLLTNLVFPHNGIWYLPIHEWLIFIDIHVGEYTSPMDPIGFGKDHIIYFFIFQ